MCGTSLCDEGNTFTYSFSTWYNEGSIIAKRGGIYVKGNCG